MINTEMAPRQRVRDAILNAVGTVEGPNSEDPGRWWVLLDGDQFRRAEDKGGRRVSRFPSQLTLTGIAADQPDPSQRPAGFVVKAPGHGYFVRSRSTDGAWWFVTGDSCSCPATTDRCWHIRRTWEFEKALTTPRPVAPTNVSAMVD